MSVTIQGTTYENLIEAPVSFDVDNVINGLTARSWDLSILMTTTEASTLLNDYTTWRNAKIALDPAEESLVVGASVSLTLPGTGGVSNLACWFLSPPALSARGAYLEVSFTLVDAAQKIEIIAKSQENQDQDLLDSSYIGTYTYNGVVINLKSPIESYRATPNVERTLSGAHYISGINGTERTRRINGFFDSDDEPTGLADINTQYETEVNSSTLTPGTWRPIEAPSYNAEVVKKNGANVIRYSVTMTFLQIS